jgi:hypothetical protein
VPIFARRAAPRTHPSSPQCHCLGRSAATTRVFSRRFVAVAVVVAAAVFFLLTIFFFAEPAAAAGGAATAATVVAVDFFGGFVAAALFAAIAPYPYPLDVTFALGFVAAPFAAPFAVVVVFFDFAFVVVVAAFTSTLASA